MLKLKGTLQVPGDKSISHRALIFAALSRGESKIYGLSPAQDCLASAKCMLQLGLELKKSNSAASAEEPLVIRSKGPRSLQAPKETLFAANSGSTIRLLAGLCAGTRGDFRFDGDESLRRRPMARVLEPLSQMGAKVTYLDKKNYPPFKLAGGNLEAIAFKLEHASAQVQSALLLAGLQAEGTTSLRLPGKVRDHSLRLFKHLGVPYEQDEQNEVLRVKRLSQAVPAFTLEIPGDLSSAAFFLAVAACLPGSELLLSKLGINPGRTLVLDVLKELGAEIELHNERVICQEPVADIYLRGGILKGSSIIDAERLALGIDEVPALALAAALSQGRLELRNAAELRVKESDRLTAIVKNLKEAGACIEASQNGFFIEGKSGIKGGSYWQSYDDHRIAMMGILANLASRDRIKIDNESCVAVSYPQFTADLKKLVQP